MPALTEQPQHLQALALAQQRRLARARYRHDTHALGQHAARRRIIELLLSRETPEHLQTATILALLTYIPRYGRSRALSVLRDAGGILGQVRAIPDTRPLGQLTPRQRAAIAAALERR